MVNNSQGAWVKTDEALLATMDLPEEEPPIPPPTPPPPTVAITPPTPSPPPIPPGKPYHPLAEKEEEEIPQKEEVIDGFLERHKRLKEIFDVKGCATEEALLEESGIDKEEMKMHEDLFISDGYSISITDKAACTFDAIKEFRKRLNQL